MDIQTSEVSFTTQRNTTDDELRVNLSANLRRGLLSLKAGRAVVVGGGPSASNYVDEIKKKQKLGFTIFALNGAGKFLNDHGIVPEYLIFYDARPDNVSFTNAKAKQYLVASYSNPAVLDALLGRNVKLFHVGGPHFVVSDVRAVEPDAHFLGGGSTVGMEALNILIMLGYRVCCLYGYDSSNKGSAHHAYDQPINDKNRVCMFEFQGELFHSEIAMAAQAREFVQAAPKFEELGLNIHVIGDGLLPTMWRADKKLRAGGVINGTLEDHERKKYERMWAVPSYRIISMGEQLVPLFIEACSPKPGDIIFDLGCGTGRASLALQDKGFVVESMDHASNCLDKEVSGKITFRTQCLWEPIEDQCDWAYCVDVMEHIPTDKIDCVLSNINKSCRKGAFFNIDFADSSFGKMTGEKLHLTIRNYHWWIDKLEEHFGDTIYYIEETGVFYSLKG